MTFHIVQKKKRRKIKEGKSFTSLRHNRLLDVPWTHQILDTLLPQGFMLVSSTQSTLQPDICRPCSLTSSELFSYFSFLVSFPLQICHHSTLLIAFSTLSFHHSSYEYQKYYLTIYLIHYCYLCPLEYLSPSMQEFHCFLMDLTTKTGPGILWVLNIQWCAGNCLMTSSQNQKQCETLIWIICQFPWCMYFHHQILR